MIKFFIICESMYFAGNKENVVAFACFYMPTHLMLTTPVVLIEIAHLYHGRTAYMVKIL
jgi:hypothetical protein